MEPFGTGEYWLVRFLFQRGLAAIYLLAFLGAARQFRPLAGEDGLFPLEEYVDRTTFTERPSLFYLFDDDRAVGGVATVGFQLWLMLTGNFSWLNALTIVQATATFSDGLIAALLPVAPRPSAPTPGYLTVAALLVAGVVAVLSVRPVKNMLSPTQRMNTSFDPLHLVNSYGAFGSVTERRYQLVIEGTDAENPRETDWTPYECRGQPVRVEARPPQWAPYHLRLDWQLWFAAMRPRPGPRQRWIYALIAGLLENDPEVVALLGSNPFDGEPPERVRVLRYRYRFTTPAERAETGAWWHRELVGTYVPPVSLPELRARDIDR